MNTQLVGGPVCFLLLRLLGTEVHWMEVVVWGEKYRRVDRGSHVSRIGVSFVPEPGVREVRGGIVGWTF